MLSCQFLSSIRPPKVDYIIRFGHFQNLLCFSSRKKSIEVIMQLFNIARILPTKKQANIQQLYDENEIYQSKLNINLSALILFCSEKVKLLMQYFSYTCLT